MTSLAASANETAFWVVAAVVGGVLVVGVLALVATLLYMLRSFSLSLEQLRDAQEDLAQARADHRGEATPGGAAADDNAPPATDVPADEEAATGAAEPATGTADEQDVERGDTIPG